MVDEASLKQSIDSLNNSISTLISLFKNITEELKAGEHGTDFLEEQLSPLIKRLNSLEEQNEKIARGIVAVADLLKERRPRYVPMQRPYTHQRTPVQELSQEIPAMPPPQRTMPEPSIRPLPRNEYPQQKEEKKGFFDMFKK